MADVTGPISSLPGAAHAMPEGAMCDLHPDRPAVARIQGETDSFGSELLDCCDECVRSVRESVNLGGTCDWCRAEADRLRDTRDPDEGLCGPVYRVCEACRQTIDARTW